MEFYSKVSPTFPIPLQSEGVSQCAGVVDQKRYLIPPPTLCPDCRQQRRLTFRNERKLYKRKCDATGKDTISIYSPDKEYRVYTQDYWWSDAWDALSYGREFDFSRSAMEQMEELMREVPKPSLLNAGCENSDYVNYSSYLKDSYLTFDAIQGEALIYGNSSESSDRLVDFMDVRSCRESYELLDCGNCYDLHYGWGCNASHTSRYVVDLENSHHCFLSHTQYNKSYIFENKKCTQEQYEENVQDFSRLSREEQQEKI